jgi:energy-coupling factor transporter ATP-binding protein EcfA2
MEGTKLELIRHAEILSYGSLHQKYILNFGVMGSLTSISYRFNKSDIFKFIENNNYVLIDLKDEIEYNENRKQYFYCNQENQIGVSIYDYESENEPIDEDDEEIVSKTNNDVFLNVTFIYNLKNNTSVDFLNKNKEYLETIKLPNKEEGGRIYMLGKNQNGWFIDGFNIPKPVIDIELNYGSDFIQTHERIVNDLTNKSKGLIILHGLPGAGKTTYIQYLATILKKRIIFVNPNMVECFADPTMSTELAKWRESIFIVEEAEKIIYTREGGNTSSAISNLLNISDGILSHYFKCQFILTTNTKIDNIDQALTREGRLIAEHEFGYLKHESCLKLAKKIGIDKKNIKTIDEKTSYVLSDIYNLKNKSIRIKKQKKKIGF